MRLNELEVGQDGFNRCLLSPFASRTGRNQPSNTKYIFGPSAWLRSLIKPKEGYGICYIDWTQQEFGIAAALSADENMMSAYSTGDSYLAFAKQAKAVPPDATKRSHKIQRENYKQCVLGKQYGMEEESLSHRISSPRIVARDLIRKHHEVFSRYWAWSDNAVDRAILEGKQQTVFGWTHHIAPGFNPRTVRNFLLDLPGGR
jgi:DNA polymerase I-like protein with 3'-5' exonuclease and polymerase domains